MGTLKCGNCEKTLAEFLDTPLESRIPCPSCGSRSRLRFVTLEVTTNGHAKVVSKGRRGGKGAPFIEHKIGEDLFRKSHQWVRYEQVIDRENDSYREVVTDPRNGKQLHRTEEPLSQHRGHGDARKNKTG